MDEIQGPVLLHSKFGMFGDGLEGSFEEDVDFNIEHLVNVLEELQKKERHTLYPFVSA